VEHFGWPEFQRNITVQAGVFRFINHAHTAATELLKNAVMGDVLSDK
jgi:hypothetical protein